jgi:hypothetical protein
MGVRYLRSVILDVVLDFGQVVNALERVQEALRLRRRAPVGVGLVPVDGVAEQCDDDVGGLEPIL